MTSNDMPKEHKLNKPQRKAYPSLPKGSWKGQPSRTGNLDSKHPMRVKPPKKKNITLLQPVSKDQNDKPPPISFHHPAVIEKLNRMPVFEFNLHIRLPSILLSLI